MLEVWLSSDSADEAISLPETTHLFGFGMGDWAFEGEGV